MATVREIQRQIGLLDGLQVEFLDAERHAFSADEELGVEWPYTQRTRGRVTVEEWRRSRITPLRPDLRVWVMSTSGYPVSKRTTLKKVRSRWAPGHFEDLIEWASPETDRESAVIVIGDRNLAEVPDLGGDTVAEGTYGLAVVAVRTPPRQLRVQVSDRHLTGMVELAEVTLKIPSRVLRIQDTEGQWHTDIPCKRPRITVYGDRVSAPSDVLIVVDRRRVQGKPDPQVELSADPKFRARERNAFEQRLAAGAPWDTVHGTVNCWRRDDLSLAASLLHDARRDEFPPSTISRPGSGVVLVSSSVHTVPSLKVHKKKRKGKKKRSELEAVDQPAMVGAPTVSEELVELWATPEPTSPRTDPPGKEDLARLLRAQRLPLFLDLEVVGEDVVAGRPCSIVDAVLRPDNPGSSGLPLEPGVNFRLYVDAERLVVLRAVNLVDGEAAEVAEFRAITFDEPISP